MAKYTITQNRKKLLSWLRSESPAWCTKFTYKDGKHCALGYVGKINNLGKKNTMHGNQYCMAECGELLGLDYYFILTRNDGSKDPKQVADKLETLFKVYPIVEKKCMT